MGNIYNNGKYFIVMQGIVSSGKLYILLYKSSDGLKVGVAASVINFRLLDLVNSATGTNITHVPYFGDLVIPSMALSITSCSIKNPTLPHVFGTETPL